MATCSAIAVLVTTIVLLTNAEPISTSYVTSPPNRAVSWWWAPTAEANGTDVDGMIDFCTKNRDIVTTLIMRCGIFTCDRNYSAPRGTCVNNGGTGGTIVGELLPSCQRALPVLDKLGIRAELWLGEDDSLISARYLFDHAEETAAALINVSKYYPTIVGYNLDLESGGNATAYDITHFQTFLTSVTKTLNAETTPIRFSVDVACASEWGGIGTQCSVLAKSGVNKLMNMRTYNAASFVGWYYAELTPALDTVPLDKLGAGLGCWIDSRTNDTWNITPQSAEQRICALMNHSIQEIDLFLLSQGNDVADKNFPEPFWIPQLQKYMTGDGCAGGIPKQVTCPKASIGPNTSWHISTDMINCCESSANRGPHMDCNTTCAQRECADAKMIWKPENFSVHPYECCH